MEIVFNEQFTTAADGGIACEVQVDGKAVSCQFSVGALEDVNPETADLGSAGQFQMNMERLHDLAREKILRGKLDNGAVLVSGEDV